MQIQVYMKRLYRKVKIEVVYVHCVKYVSVCVGRGRVQQMAEFSCMLLWEKLFLVQAQGYLCCSPDTI